MCKERGYTTWIFPVEIGCRGYPAQSVWKALDALDIKAWLEKALYGPLVRRQRGRPVGSGYDAIKQHDSHH
ncbi:hypothetical protein DPMN_022302 [Dreissena polymorpha]|uniref:Uncharacterized protein n=1 Tax=Dreissena polymorpha TaxID=45954 RepID=A0A9D4NNN6_DREPO|nr:hypothetical protein DPMN_022302 [Dreissena polymorpha]